jgi:hypothetical protein
MLYIGNGILISKLLEYRQKLLETCYLRSRHRVVVTRQSLPELTKHPNWEEWIPQQLHISKDRFRELVSLIQDNPVFSNNSTCNQLEVWDKLVVFLRYMVLPGNTDATLASDMGLGTGTVSKVVNRVKLAKY